MMLIRENNENGSAPRGDALQTLFLVDVTKRTIEAAEGIQADDRNLLETDEQTDRCWRHKCKNYA